MQLLLITIPFFNKKITVHDVLASGHKPSIGSAANSPTLPIVDVVFVPGKAINS